MKLVRIVKNWETPNLMRQTPNYKGVWGDIQFTLESVEECDYLVVLNHVSKETIRARCYEENIWALMQEPYMAGHSDWMVEGHDAFAKVLTHHIPSNDNRYVSSHPAIPWHVNRSYDELFSCEVPEKTRDVSWVVGNARDLPGHIKRWDLLRRIQSCDDLNIDLFGRAVQFIEDKWDGLGPYRFTLAVENTSKRDYWTEKVADCFLTWTIPFYYGCTNLEDYFPEESFIRIDIERPDTCIRKIKNCVAEIDWNKKIPALEKARNLVLEQYQLFPHLAGFIDASFSGNSEKTVRFLTPYKRSATAVIKRLGYKLRKKFGML